MDVLNHYDDGFKGAKKFSDGSISTKKSPRIFIPELFHCVIFENFDVWKDQIVPSEY